MLEFRNQLINILENGFVIGEERTGTGTINLHGIMMRFDLSKSFPVVNDRFTPVKMALGELHAFMNAITNLEEMGITKKFWERWAHPGNDELGIQKGYLGPVYGAQMRDFDGKGIDQLQMIIDTLRTTPYSRRHLISYYNPAVLPDESKPHNENIEDGKQVLPPCHLLVHALIRPPKEEGGKKILDLLLYQRSADMPVGVPANIVYYAAFAHLLAKAADMDVGELIHTIGSAHIYLNQVDNVKKMLALANVEQSPQLVIHGDKENIWEYTPDDFELVDYTPGPHIDMPVSV